MKKTVLLLVGIVCFLPTTWADYMEWSVGNMEWRRGHGAKSTKVMMGDVDDDGDDDFVSYFAENALTTADGQKNAVWDVGESHRVPGVTFWNYVTWMWGGYASANQFLADVNDDGKADAVTYSNGIWYVALSNGSKFDGYSQWVTGHGSGSHNQFLADVNDDNKADAVVVFTSGGLAGKWYVALSNGSGFERYSQWITEHGAEMDLYTMGDVDGDGKADAIAYKKGTDATGTFYVARSTGSSFEKFAKWTSAFTVKTKQADDTYYTAGNAIPEHIMVAKPYLKGRGSAIVAFNGYDEFKESPNGSSQSGFWFVSDPTCVPVYFNVSETDWGEEIEVHAWSTGGKSTYNVTLPATKLEHKHATTTWYRVMLPATNQVTIQVQKKGAASVGDKSVEITMTRKEAAYIIHAETETGANHEYTQSNELDVIRSFVYTAIGDKEYYSNRLESVPSGAGDQGTVSYFTTKDAEATYHFCHGNDIYGYDENETYPGHKYYTHTDGKSIKQTQELDDATNDTIYFADVEITSGTNIPYSCKIGTPEIYSGDYYIRTTGASGGWDDYKQEDKDNKMTYFAEKAGYKDKDRYYWVKWLEGVDTKAVLANAHNAHLAEVDPKYTLGKGEQDGAHVRYGYEPGTNTLGCTRLASDAVDNYLMAYEESTSDDATDKGNGVEFKELKNFDYLYEADIYTLPNTAATVEYEHDDKTETANMLFKKKNHAHLGGTGFEGSKPAEYRHKLRLYYDYKTDRVYSAWIPRDPISGSTDKNVAHNLCTYRSGNGAATEIVPLEGTAKLTTSAAVFELTIESKEQLLESGGYFWFSLPFDCLVKDVKGGTLAYGAVDNAVANNNPAIDWAIQRYRGDTRTQNGSLPETGTYWRYLNNASQTATLEANRGYVLQVNRAKADSYTYPLTFFFPAYTAVGLSANATVTAPIHDNPAGVADHTNWNLVGSGALRAMKAEGWNAGEVTRSAVQQFFYGWYWYNDQSMYYLMNAEENAMQPTQSYFVQYGGNIAMAPWVDNTASQLVALRAPKASTIYAMRMEISDGEQTDKTYIILDATATDAYDVNLDLGKIVNAGMPQIYTMCANSKLAANNLSVAETKTVTIGVQATAAGTYTFSMPQVATGVTPVLYDMETGDVVNIAIDDYSVYLEAGTYEARFLLRMHVPGVATDVPSMGQDAILVTQVGKELLVSGVTGDVDIRLYDALGRLLYYTDNAHAMIPVEQTGVYVLQVNGVAQRVLVR